MTPLPAEVIWSVSLLHVAVPLLAGKAALPHDHQAVLEPLIGCTPPEETICSWLNTAARQLGLELLAVETGYAEVEQLIAHGAPALFFLPEQPQNELCFIAAAAVTSGRMQLLGHDGRLHRLKIAQVQAALTVCIETPVLPVIEEMLDKVGTQGKQRRRTRQALLRECLAAAKIDRCWLLRLPPSASFACQLRRARFLRQIIWLIGATLLNRLLMLTASLLLGKTILQGKSDLTIIQIWGLLLLSMTPLQILAVQIKNRLALQCGLLLRRRLLSGILQLKAVDIQHQGSGYFLGNVQEIEKLEALGLSTAFAACIACMEVLTASGVLLYGAGGMSHGLLLLAWTGGIILFGHIWHQRTQEWQTHHRLMTRDLVERTVGHRTRSAQEKTTDRHTLEDQLVARHAELAKKADSIQAVVETVASRRGWLPASLLFTAFTAGTDIASLAVSLGGTLLAASALDQLTQSVRQFIEAATSWEQVQPLYQAATRERAKKPTSFATQIQIAQRRQAGGPIVEACEVSFAYSGAKGRNVLDQCSLTVRSGQHLLLEGQSGGGKSTLAALLSGLEQPDSGSVRLFGLTRAALGEEAWHRRVVIAPQFHQNYVLTETFAFNLLMGRAWPPSKQDIAEAEAVCNELHLGELLETMPAGLQQMVGESGWRLSHGERSRLFVARTLLQQADLIILDESFAALDPETLSIALSCVLRRSNALLLIAHP